MNRLHKFLKGDALKAVEGLMINPNNVDAIIGRLEKLYRNPDAVYAILLKDLLAIKHISMKTPSTFVEFANALHNLVDNMTMLKHENYLNRRLLKDLVSKLPTDIWNDWILEILKYPGSSGMDQT